jgi:DeoR family fructose operon transcriptional repressor
MLTQQREAAIVERVRTAGSATVEELSRVLAVSGTTIRRDLERLELTGVLRRVHGGATLPETGADELEDPDADAAEKRAIAAVAAGLIRDGDVVLLDIGHTTLAIARHLRDRPVTLVTNNLWILRVLGDNPACTLILLGGTVGSKPGTVSGPLTEQMLDLIHADVAVISSGGVRPDGAVVTDLNQEATIKHRMSRAADRSILVVTSLKFPGEGAFRIASLQDFDTIVTTADAPRAPVEVARRRGVEVLYA